MHGNPLSLRQTWLSSVTAVEAVTLSNEEVSTGIACAQLGRHFLGWERDAAMAALAQRRLAGLRAVPVPGQIEMFG